MLLEFTLPAELDVEICPELSELLLAKLPALEDVKTGLEYLASELGSVVGFSHELSSVSAQPLVIMLKSSFWFINDSLDE